MVLVNSLVDLKYRICKSASSDDRVVFFCDCDTLHKPGHSFLGKPIYFSSAKTAGMGFTLKSIRGEQYMDLSKLSPQSAYLSDLSLKLLCINLLPDIILDNSKSPLQTLCEVDIKSIEFEVSSVEVFKTLIEQNGKYSEILKDIRTFTPSYAEIGLVGYQALNHYEENEELDIVFFAENVDHLIKIKENFQTLELISDTPYVKNLWPLSGRTKVFGSIDLFLVMTDTPTSIHRHVATSNITNLHEEFHGKIIDDSMSILTHPLWRLEDGRWLFTVDGALRGRFRTGDEVVGVGISITTQDNSKVIIIQLGENITKTK